MIKTLTNKLVGLFYVGSISLLAIVCIVLFISLAFILFPLYCLWRVISAAVFWSYFKAKYVFDALKDETKENGSLF